MYIRGGLIILRPNKADKRLSRLSILSATLSIFLSSGWSRMGRKGEKKTSLFGILHVGVFMRVPVGAGLAVDRWMADFSGYVGRCVSGLSKWACFKNGSFFWRASVDWSFKRGGFSFFLLFYFSFSCCFTGGFGRFLLFLGR